jgi:acyl-CoA reductase-like NAD-dependent aldehyde dehydrogenase
MVDTVNPLPRVALADVLLRGGMKESGIGRENGLEAFEACMLSCAIVSNIDTSVYRFSEQVHHRKYRYS